MTSFFSMEIALGSIPRSGSLATSRSTSTTRKFNDKSLRTSCCMYPCKHPSILTTDEPGIGLSRSPSLTGCIHFVGAMDRGMTGEGDDALISPIFDGGYIGSVL